MKALSLTLLCLGSWLFFFGVDATKIESWNLAKQVADPRVHSFIRSRSRDVRDILRLPSQETRRIRIHTKREPACRLPICNAQDLVNRLNQWTDSSLETAPPEQLTTSGYGRRRRSFAFLVQG